MPLAKLEFLENINLLLKEAFEDFKLLVCFKNLQVCYKINLGNII